jgi:FAD/FMN-containing dehydrogenase
MTDSIEGILYRLGNRLHGCLSTPGDGRYAVATAIWAKPVGPMPRAIAHCRTSEDVQSAIRAALDCDLSLSVRGGGHDWAGRALCDGLVIDLSEMYGVAVDSVRRVATIFGGARASDVVAMTDPLGLAPVTGSCGTVGMAGLTLGGGYGVLTPRFGLTLDNLLAAKVVLADGRIVTAKNDSEEELFWALRGGGGNFGVVTAMQHRLHDLSSVRAGTLIFPFAEAKTVLEGCADIAACAPEALTVQVFLIVSPDGTPPGHDCADVVRPARTRRITDCAVLPAGNAGCRQCGRDAVWKPVGDVRRVYRPWPAYLHGNVLASFIRQRQHRRIH